MNRQLEGVCNALDNLASIILQSTTEDRTMAEFRGPLFPPLNKRDLAQMASQISDRIRGEELHDFTDQANRVFNEIIERVNVFNRTSYRHMFAGQNSLGTLAYVTLIQWIKLQIDSVFGWRPLEGKEAMPPSMAERLIQLQKEMDAVIVNKDELTNDIASIKDAAALVQAFPNAVKELDQTKRRVDQIYKQAAEVIGKMDLFHEKAINVGEQIEKQKLQTDSLVQQCEEAYRITTTKGLAAAFDQRAERLTRTMWIWVVGLLVALIIGGFIGASRFEILINALQTTQVNWAVVWMDFILAIIGLAAPVWFAWLSTRQISQRFRLSEDYAFKASVAKAYEGYRKEASRFDEALEARLFSSALSRLEEAPLRVIHDEQHSSPWGELFNSYNFRKAMETVPELKEEFIRVTKEKMGKLNGKKKAGEEIV